MDTTHGSRGTRTTRETRVPPRDGAVVGRAVVRVGVVRVGVVRPAGIEPATRGLGVPCSIH